MEPFTAVVRDRLPYFLGNIPSGIAGNGVSTTCCTPRHSTRKVAPPLFQCSLVQFYFPRSCCVHFQTCPSLSSQQHSIYFYSQGLEKHVVLEDQQKCHMRHCIIPDHHPSKITLQCSTAFSYKMTLSPPFLEGSTAEAMIQVAEP